MSLCVAGITALQLYYSYTNYRFAEKVFKRNTNEALLEARDSVTLIHHRNVENKFREWMNDTTFVKITSKWDDKQKTNIFTIKELHEHKENGQIEISLSIEAVTKKIDSMTPEMKKRFIDHMVETVDSGLKRGTVWFFTQGIGDRLSEAYYKTRIDSNVINEQYRLALARHGISLGFTLSENERGAAYCTKKVNFGVDDERWLKACFSQTGAYLLKQLKWVIAGSLALVLITMFCFWYTAHILLTQQKLSRLKDNFISNMTHEIHTPLTSITVTAEALKKFSHNEEERQNYIDIILHQSRKLAMLTDEILNGARLEKKGLEMGDSVDINQLLENVIADFDHNGKKIVLNLCTTSVIFSGNKLHLHNAVANLVDNALKYNSSPDPTVEITYSVGKNVTITVSDNGPGIPDADKKKVFDQFYRIPSGNVHDVKGYGLGLSYVKKVIEAHNGSITIEDNQPRGASFILTLPL